MDRKTKIWIHVTYWVLTVFINFTLWTIPYFKVQSLGEILAGLGMHYFVVMTFFYLNYALLVPIFLIQKKYLQYALILSLPIFLIFIGLSIAWGGYRTGEFFPKFDRIGAMIQNIIAFLFGSTALKLFDYWITSEKNKIELEKEVKQAELLFLKSQINPHFLFNTLNNIYGLSLKKSDKTTLAIAQLKELMIYIDDFGTSSKATLKSEIFQLQNFINLSKLRHHVKVNFQPKTDPQTENMFFEPMILLPFIENAFKHGNTDDNSEINIELSTKNKLLLFSVENTFKENKRIDNVGGIGITNIKRRLELVYGKKFTLVVAKNKEHYKASLKVDFSE